MEPTPNPSDRQAQLAALIARHRDRDGPLLPLLHDVQHSFGCILPEFVGTIAAALDLSRAEVHGVITYYPHFRSAPAGRHVVQVCRAEACQACGADELLAHAEQVFGCRLHETRADGAVTLEPVYCLGLCASSPALQVDERLHARMTPQRLDRLASTMEAA